MAKQHFYSRVPARASMFNKADSFDTFACSDGLTREFIEKELSAVTENQPTANEALIIRKGELPPVYFMNKCASGELALSCTSYIPSDYTGERSSYLVHTLVLSEQEKESLLKDKEKEVFSENLFVKDIAPFAVTDEKVRADCNYPEMEYAPSEREDSEWVIKTYKSDMLRRFIYAMLDRVCGKGKNVFVVLPDSLATLSSSALRFMNAFLSILPAGIKSETSFATYTTDFAKLKNFKIKFLPASASAVPTDKGVTVNFKRGDIIGIKDDDVAHQLQLVDFFLGLLSNNEVRREFLMFIEHACAETPTLQGAMSLKVLSDLVFLFRCSSGLFGIESVLKTDDKIYEMVCVYEKYRKVLTDEHRINAFKCLRRYSEHSIAIPKNVFSKLGKIYPSETPAVKRVIMNVVLDLSHTDVMRDKLFAFIKNNYHGEEQDMRATIVGDLSRVYYGGFLQPQILEFFAQNFKEEEPGVRAPAIDKILLTVRTKAVQPRILEFLRSDYEFFTKEEKFEFYDVVMEMLPEGDELAEAFISLVDEKILLESDEEKTSVAERICKLAEGEQKRREHPMLAKICLTNGFCFSAVAAKVVNDWTERQIFAEFCDNIAAQSIVKRAESIALVVSENCFDEAKEEKFLGKLADAFVAAGEKMSAFSVIEAENVLEQKLGSSKKVANFLSQAHEKLFLPLVKSNLPSMFKSKNRLDAAETLANYVQKHPELKKAESFVVGNNFLSLVDAIKKQDAAKAALSCKDLQCGQNLGKDIAAYLDKMAWGEMNSSSLAVKRMVIGNLENGNYAFYSAYREIALLGEKVIGSDKKPNEKAMFIVHFDSAKIVLDSADAIYKKLSETERANMLKVGSETEKTINGLIARFGGSAKKKLIAEVFVGYDGAFSEYCQKTANAVKSANGGFFASIAALFSKK